MSACSVPSASSPNSAGLSGAASSAIEAVDAASEQLDTLPVVGEISAALGCVSLEPLAAVDPATSYSFCQLATEWHAVGIATFSSNTDRDAFVEQTITDHPGTVYATGDRWFAGSTKCTPDDLAPLVAFAND